MIERFTHEAGTVDIRTDGYSFPVWQGDKVIGTIHRPSKFYGVKRWTAYLADGTDIGTGVGPRTAFRLIVGHGGITREEIQF